MKANRTGKIIGWILSALLGIMLMGLSASGKFLEWEGKAQMLETMGLTNDLLFKIGILEIAITLLFLVPRTALWGAILLTGYLGGATLTHLRINEPFFMPILIGVIVWIALGLRDPRVFELAFRSPSSAT